MPLSDKKLAVKRGRTLRRGSRGPKLEARRKGTGLGATQPAQSLEVGDRRKQGLKSQETEQDPPGIRSGGRRLWQEQQEGVRGAGLCSSGG